MKKQILVLGTSVKTRGGISQVILRKIDSLSSLYDFTLAPTHSDTNVVDKLRLFCRAFSHLISNFKRYDIYHYHLSQPVSLFRKSLLLAVTPRKKPIIIHYHAAKNDIKFSALERFLLKYIGFRCSVFVVLSELWYQGIVDNGIVDQRKCKVIYNPAHKPEHDSKSISREKIILFSGTLNKRKNYENLLKAFKYIHANNKDYCLHFAGNGELQEAKFLAKSLGLIDNVVFHGWLGTEEMTRLYQSASVFCLPSFAEGLPMALIDAWSNEIPVVCSNVGGISDILRKRRAAITVDPHSPRDIADNIMDVIENNSLSENLVHEGKKLVNTVLSQELFIEKMKTVYKNVL